jgi:phage shock protein E
MKVTSSTLAAYTLLYVAFTMSMLPPTVVAFLAPWVLPSSRAAASAATPVVSRRTQQKLLRPFMAAPGVVTDPDDAIREALANPATTVVDARNVEEMQQDGYFASSTCKFVHAPSTKDSSPLLQLAAPSLIPDTSAPVVVYCKSGIRATAAKKALEDAGYKTVLNAGGYDDIQKFQK